MKLLKNFASFGCFHLLPVLRQGFFHFMKNHKKVLGAVRIYLDFRSLLIFRESEIVAFRKMSMVE